MHKQSLGLILFISFAILCSCAQATREPGNGIVESTPSTPAQTIVPEKASFTPPPDMVPSQTPRSFINLDGYTLTYEGSTCPFKAVEFYDRYVFQADCDETVYIPQGTTIRVTLDTPDGQPLPIAPVPDVDALFGALEPGFILCQFDSVDASNTITFGSPFQQTTGREILCGFTVPLQGKEVVMVLTGLTTR